MIQIISIFRRFNKHIPETYIHISSRSPVAKSTAVTPYPHLLGKFNQVTSGTQMRIYYFGMGHLDATWNHFCQWRLGLEVPKCITWGPCCPIPWFGKFDNGVHNYTITLGPTYKPFILLPHRKEDKLAGNLQLKVSNAFLSVDIFVFWPKFHWSLFLGSQFTTYHHWDRKLCGATQVTSHSLNKWWPC